MAWLQIQLPVSREQTPLVERLLEQAGALSVTLADAGDDPQLEPAPDATPLWPRIQVTGLFDDDPVAREQVVTLSATLRKTFDVVPLVNRLDEQVWERVWLERFRPKRFGRRLWVCPHGQRPSDPDAVVLALDPGLAFGTGHHPTTELCLTWLDEQPDLTGRAVLDFGCGSGILAIAAVRLGAARALAVDHDPQALEATVANAAANGLASRIDVRPPQALSAAESVDLLVANILAGPLIALACTFADHLRPGGELALSGILAEQVDAVAETYRRHFDLGPPRIQEGWALLRGRRRAPESGLMPPG